MDRRVIAQVGRDASEEGHQLALRIHPDALKQTYIACQKNRCEQRIPIVASHNRGAAARRFRRLGRSCRLRTLARQPALLTLDARLVARVVTIRFVILVLRLRNHLVEIRRGVIEQRGHIVDVDNVIVVAVVC